MEEIQDMMEKNLVNLRKVIYLTIMNALNHEEAVHKLLKTQPRRVKTRYRQLERVLGWQL